MRPRDRQNAQRFTAGLLAFSRRERELPGIRNPANRRSFVEQLLESMRRVRYVSVIQERQLSSARANPRDELFDPLKASILHRMAGRLDEAFWLVFLFVHFGRHPRAGWRYARDVYGRLGGPGRWDWASVIRDPARFRAWLKEHLDELRRGGLPRGFGNHRKYQSLDPYSSSGTGAAVEGYVEWVDPPRTHPELMELACNQAAGDSRRAFHTLYQSMAAVPSFGRTARFDYFTMIGKLGLAAIEPGLAYLQGSTGPLRGAHLLFGGDSTAPISPTDLDSWLVELDARLNVGMQVLEDSLCNWQKSPQRFRPFRG